MMSQVRFGWSGFVTRRPMGLGRQISQLQARRIGLFVGEDDLESRHGTPLVGAVADAAEGEFEIVVLPACPGVRRSGWMVRGGVLALVLEEGVGTFHAEGEGDLVRVGWMDVLPS